MRIVAVINVRNEELFIKRCLEHLISQGVEIYLIDNESSDNTVKIAEHYLGKGLLKIDRLPYAGELNLLQILKNKEKIIRTINADWFMHYDADEIREAPSRYKTLKEAFIDIDRKGYNALNFDEFVFVPTEDNVGYEKKDYVVEMKYYYFFEPFKLRRLNAWKKIVNVEADLVSEGGHQIQFKGMNVFPESFILRHYIGLSKNHLIAKHAGRRFAKADTEERGWHYNRLGIRANGIVLPARNELKLLRSDGNWDRSSPKSEHLFLNRKHN